MLCIWPKKGKRTHILDESHTYNGQSKPGQMPLSLCGGLYVWPGQENPFHNDVITRMGRSPFTLGRSEQRPVCKRCLDTHRKRKADGRS